MDANQLNFECSSIPMLKSYIGYYNFTDSSIDPDLKDNGFQFSNITLLYLHKSSRSIKSNASGCDGIHPKFLNIVLDYIDI